MSTLAVYVRLYSLNYQRPKPPKPNPTYTSRPHATDRGRQVTADTAHPSPTDSDTRQRAGQRPAHRKLGEKRKETRMNRHADLPAIMTPIRDPS